MSNRLHGTRVAAEVVHEVWRLAGQEGLGAKAIANRLYDRGIAISASTVWRIIRKEREKV